MAECHRVGATPSVSPPASAAPDLTPSPLTHSASPSRDTLPAAPASVLFLEHPRHALPPPGALPGCFLCRDHPFRRYAHGPFLCLLQVCGQLIAFLMRPALEVPLSSLPLLRFFHCTYQCLPKYGMSIFHKSIVFVVYTSFHLNGSLVQEWICIFIRDALTFLAHLLPHSRYSINICRMELQWPLYGRWF